MDGNTLADRYEAVKAALPPGVKLVAVSKKRTVDEIKALYDLGQRAFGENYPQELKDKAPLLPADIEWHFIGHLQRNKVKYVLPFAHLIHGVDRTALLDDLDQKARAGGRTAAVLLQAHIAREETKHGFSTAELRALFAAGDVAGRWPALRFRGLMAMASNTGDHAQVRAEFAGLAALHRELRALNAVPAAEFSTLSMGMSGDLREALESGSTLVRVGTAIFGQRG